MDNYIKKNGNIKKIKIKKKLNDEEYFNFIFSDLASKGINNLLIETGAKLNTILLSLNLVDEILIFRSGKIIGNDGIPFINDLGFQEIEQLKNYKVSSLSFFEDDILEIRHLNI
jgi:riboflavin biosynthesis pyrimidine reductase